MNSEDAAAAVAPTSDLHAGATASDLYTVVHETRYAYRAPVAQSWQLAHLTPRELPWQRVVAHGLDIEPPPDERHDARDAYGNGVTHFGVHGPHSLLRVRMRAVVEVADRPNAARHDDRLPWDDVREAIATASKAERLIAARMAEPSSLVPWSQAARDWAEPTFAPGRDWLDSVTELMHRIHAEFAFEPGATTVTTSVDEVIAQKSGVCQDFAHVMLACLRAYGLPARYVSGYLLTQPPPGQKRLLGADASHAWVAAYSPGCGWVEFDPTNDAFADRRHVTLAWGADFADVVPLRGVILGGRGQKMSVGVSVIPG